MPTTLTIPATVSADGKNGSVTIDVRASGVASGVLAATLPPRQLNAIVPPTAAPTLGSAVVGGAAGGTRYAAVVYRGNGGSSLPSPVAGPATVASGSALTVSSPPATVGTPAPAGGDPATGYDVYAGTTASGLTRQNATPIAIGTPWTEPSSGLVAGAALPTSDSTGIVNGPATVTVTFGA